MTAGEKDLFLEEALGPQHKYGEEKVIIPTIIYSAISIFGIPGNILTCLTIITNSYLKTAPNYFIFNLAIVDLITLIIGNVITNSYVKIYRIIRSKIIYVYLLIIIFYFSYTHGNITLLEKLSNSFRRSRLRFGNCNIRDGKLRFHTHDDCFYN